MTRYLAIILSIGAWGYLLVHVPRWPGWLFVIPTVFSMAAYLYQTMVLRGNKMGWFYATLLFFGETSGLWLREQCEIQSVSIPPVLILRLYLILFFILAIFITLAGYRITLNFRQRRGNLEKQQLVQSERPFLRNWQSINRRFSRKRDAEISLTLGEEIQMRD